MTDKNQNSPMPVSSPGEFRQHYRRNIIKLIARQLRNRPTQSEKLLWQALRKRQLAKLKFLRQHPIGPSIVDFYCHEKRLAVEVDGGIHHNRDVKERDQARQELIEMYGIKFYRCTSEQVEHDLEGVLEGILKAAGVNNPPPGPPSLRREGGFTKVKGSGLNPPLLEYLDRSGHTVRVGDKRLRPDG